MLNSSSVSNDRTCSFQCQRGSPGRDRPASRRTRQEKSVNTNVRFAGLTTPPSVCCSADLKAGQSGL